MENKRRKTYRLLLLMGLSTLLHIGAGYGQKQVEKLGRGLVVFKYNDHHVFLSWRLLADDPQLAGFNVFRQEKGKAKIKLNAKPLRGGTNFTDSMANFSSETTWSVMLANSVGHTRIDKAADDDNKISSSAALSNMMQAKQYLSIPLQLPAAGEIDGVPYSYSANDASAADLDWDGDYEIILKWEPSNAKNPPQTGITANQILDAYKMDGTLLWRIDLGKNIRSGAAYTQFLVYDFDGDGKSELITKTADGTIDGQGKVLGHKTKDWRTYEKTTGTYGKIVNGPEFLSVFNGLTGAEMATVSFVPDRYPLDGWGGTGGNGGNDHTGGRSDRFTAGVAYLDGRHPSAFFVRGWYGRTVIAAWDWSAGKLTNRWIFDSKNRENPYSGMANHSVSVADMDGDGKDEICVGAMTVDDNGKGLYTTGFGHGDALHVTKMSPKSSAVSVFGIHEIEDTLKTPVRPGVALYDGKTGKAKFTIGRNVDVGRGVAADIDPTHMGFENWGGPGGLRDLNGKTISNETPGSTNFVVWWDGDLTRELLDKNRIDKWDWRNGKTINLFTAEGAVANNGTKATPALSADLFGDWREEVIWKTKDSKELRIYTTIIPTDYRMVTLMQDPQYRTSIAGQNVGYSQPPHPGFYLGAGMQQGQREKVRLVERKPINKTERLIFSDDFHQTLDTAIWQIELQESPGSFAGAQDGKLILRTGKGVTVWLKKKLKGNIRISYDRKVIVNGGVMDRLSDLNQFWMASDPVTKKLSGRNGELDAYNSLQLYYVGMGGNYNSTTRFRKYDGKGNRELLAEYADQSHLLIANKLYHIETIVENGEVSFWVDQQKYFSYTDAAVLKEGYFGFRSTKSNQEIYNLRIYQIL